MLKKGIRKADIVLLLLLLLLSALLFYRRSLRGGEAEAVLVISFDGREILKGRLCEDPEALLKNAEHADAKYLSLQDGKLVFSHPDGGSNVLEIVREDGEPLGIRCIRADCPDKICIRTGIIRLETEPIVCLPHRLMVRLER